MKTCRTLTGLLKAIEKDKAACLKYTDKAYNPSENGWIIYLQSGTNLIVTDETYNSIKDCLVRI
jgi:hypothetical protein